MVNISLKCDCAGEKAPEPNISDIGILASLDPVAIDKACYDLIHKLKTDGSKARIAQSILKNGTNTLIVAQDIGLGMREYYLIDIDEKKLSFYMLFLE